MSADAPPPFEDVPQTSAQDTSAPDTSAHPDQSQTAPTANGNSLKDAFVDSEVRADNILSLSTFLLTLSGTSAHNSILFLSPHLISPQTPPLPSILCPITQ